MTSKLLNPNNTSALAEGSSIAVVPNDPNYVLPSKSYDYPGENKSNPNNQNISFDGHHPPTVAPPSQRSPASALCLRICTARKERNLAISARGTWSAGSDHIVWLGADGIPWYFQQWWTHMAGVNQALRAWTLRDK